MAVYVDNMYTIPLGNFRGMKMSHMIADSTEELKTMAKKIGANIKWIQCAGTAREHFDICISKRKKAIQCGAIEITMQALANRIAGRREYPIKWK